MLRSVTAKILIWSLSTLVLSLVASAWISKSVAGGPLEEAFARMDEFQLHEARSAYERGGRGDLEHYLAELRRFEGSERYLTDSAGLDLLTGEDRSAMLRGSERRRRSYVNVGDKIAVSVASADWRYRFIIVVLPPYSVATFAPYYFLLLGVVAVLFWFLAMHFAWPLRRLAAAVRRFGGGDLSARVGIDRRDEIGELGRSFDGMAARIQTLLTAERQLLQDVSHELRSPLTRLKLAAELVGTADDRTAAVSRLRRETDRLSDLVSCLLQMTMAEGDPAAFSVEDVSLSDILREAVRDCELEAEQRGCHIEVDVPEDVRTLGDTELLQRAIENIVRNAIRYSPAGELVETKIVVDEARTVLSVRDRGPGVPEELLPKIFNPFFRVDESRHASTGGMGLGLAIAERAIRLHHGALRASNAAPGLLVSIVLQRAEKSATVYSTRQDSGPHGPHE
jgi:two-component system sensor histidine kinase CpxA